MALLIDVDRIELSDGIDKSQYNLVYDELSKSYQVMERAEGLRKMNELIGAKRKESEATSALKDLGNLPSLTTPDAYLLRKAEEYERCEVTHVGGPRYSMEGYRSPENYIEGREHEARAEELSRIELPDLSWMKGPAAWLTKRTFIVLVEAAIIGVATLIYQGVI